MSTTAAEINAAQGAERIASVSAINAETRGAKSAPAPRSATKRPSAATRKANATKSAATLTKPAARKTAATKTTKTAATKIPSKLAAAKVTKPTQTGPTPTAMKRAAAALACDVLGAAFSKLTDAQAAKLGTDKATVGLMFATALNYIPTPTDHWHAALPDRSFAGGRGTKARRASA